MDNNNAGELLMSVVMAHRNAVDIQSKISKLKEQHKIINDQLQQGKDAITQHLINTNNDNLVYDNVTFKLVNRKSNKKLSGDSLQRELRQLIHECTNSEKPLDAEIVVMSVMNLLKKKEDESTVYLTIKENNT
ncbi:hypothetical protein [Trichoplusia ni ascovirus 2c]|uniref:hypothetical protein n=1 Tax=Trichoplusia ni ascovirus 2c TaxID=328615 RepID=UPI0000E441FA|nr:hypothetical protein TNAV2c_gp034 [Trichoplusia ni ascovirus 2c]ABF70551.1 hypothetical protein [Trichoplusia ni ascovirus 2c]AUS94137.1 hypothetical protein [Trichoplusia ni ascovirus 6b]